VSGVSPAPASRRGGRVIDLIFGSSSAVWSEEVRALLESRLKVSAIVANAVMAAFLLNLFVFSDLSARLPKVELAVQVAAAAWLALVSVVFFARRSPPSLALLRAADSSVVLALCIALFVWGYGWLSHGVTLEEAAPPALAGALRGRPWAISGSGAGAVFHFAPGGTVLPARLVVSWGLFAVVYGVFVPNTWRRGATVLSLMVVLPLISEVAAAVHNPVLRPMLGPMLFSTLYALATFAVVALYGCHKLETLRRAAFDARHVGQYKLVREIGRGGMGEVHLAEHRHLRRPCAVKLIRAGHATEAHVARFEREVQSMARLTHPNTVEVYDYGRTDSGTFFYAMEFLPGMTFEELVEAAGPLPPGRVIHLLRQACGALAEAHALGFIHRDVKPANLFVCERGGLHDFVKILDFGIVKDLSVGELPTVSDRAGLTAASSLEPPSSVRLTQGGAILGTPAYASPEQVRGEDADARSDVYALGGVAFHLLSGAPAFSARDLFELCIAQLETSPPHPSERNADVPADLDAVVMRCLAKDPAERFQSAHELEAALAACAAASPWDSARAAAWWAEHGGAPVRPRRTSDNEAHALALDETQPANARPVDVA
jgi:serine/threonine-protein kinase